MACYRVAHGGWRVTSGVWRVAGGVLRVAGGVLRVACFGLVWRMRVAGGVLQCSVLRRRVTSGLSRRWLVAGKV